MTIRILACDGGGIRAYFQALVLAGLELVEGKPCRELFHQMAGTSGGAIVTGLLAAGAPAVEIANLFVRLGPSIFAASWMHKIRTGFGLRGPKYDSSVLIKALKDILGGVTMGELDAHLLLPSYNMTTGEAQVFSTDDAAVADVPLWQAILASAAAPTYFAPVEINKEWYIDGGVFANNPARLATISARHLWPGAELVTVRVGSGSENKKWDGSKAQRWTPITWLKALTHIFIDGPMEAVDGGLQLEFGGHYISLDCQGVGVGLDDASSEALTRLEGAAEKAFSSFEWEKALGYLS